MILLYHIVIDLSRVIYQLHTMKTGMENVILTQSKIHISLSATGLLINFRSEIRPIQSEMQGPNRK